MLQKAADETTLKNVLVMKQAWVPYPAYTDRAAWDSLMVTVQCADETRYYRDGQRVERFILKKEDGTQTYVYESEDVVTQEQGVFEKG